MFVIFEVLHNLDFKCASYVSRMFVIFEVLHNLDFRHDTIPGGLFFSVTISFILPSSSPTQSRG